MIVLDTHVWVWWVSDPTLLSAKAKTAIDRAITEKGFLLSSISAWEVAVLVKKGRIQLTLGVRDWIAKTEGLPFVRFVPVTNRIAVQSVELPGVFHDDPADRLITATALTMGATLITKDRKILEYEHVKTLW